MVNTKAKVERKFTPIEEMSHEQLLDYCRGLQAELIVLVRQAEGRHRPLEKKSNRDRLIRTITFTSNLEKRIIEEEAEYAEKINRIRTDDVVDMEDVVRKFIDTYLRDAFPAEANKRNGVATEFVYEMFVTLNPDMWDVISRNQFTHIAKGLGLIKDSGKSPYTKQVVGIGHIQCFLQKYPTDELLRLAKLPPSGIQ